MKQWIWLLLFVPACYSYRADLRSKEPYERYLGVMKLPDRPTPQNVEVILAFLKDDAYIVREGALIALGRIKRPDLSAFAVPLLGDPDFHVRAQACTVVAGYSQEGGLAKLIELAKSDPDISVRRAAAAGLQKFGKLKQVIDALVDALGDNDGGVAYAAYNSLKSVTGESLPQDKSAWEKKFRGP